MDERPEGIAGLVEPEPCKTCGTTGKNTNLGGPRKPLCPACEGGGWFYPEGWDEAPLEPAE
jgi:hypothetical protein